MRLVAWGLIIAVSVVLDQVSKSIVVERLMPVGNADFLPGFIGFRYVENTGAAFGMMKGLRWVFISLSTVAVIGIIIYLIVRRKTVHPLTGVALAMIAGGGIGNQIDRIANGYVVDFIEFQFVDFAIFNIADSFVTVGAALIIISVLFFDKNLFGESEKKKKAVPAKGAESPDDGRNQET